MRVTVRWLTKVNEKNQQTQSISVNMTAQHILTKACGHSSSAQDNMFLPIVNAPLSSLHILPSLTTSSGSQRASHPPIIMAIRHVLPSMNTQFSHDSVTLVDRWTLSDAPQTVHSAFEHLPSKRNTTTTELEVNIQ